MAERDGLMPAQLAHEPYAAVSETHSAVVFFAGDRVYKLKKPVSLGFLDFSTPEARAAACQRETELNRRFAPDVYLGVAEVRDPAGRVCDHLAAMRRMPASRRLSALIQAGEPVSAAVRQVASQRDFLARYFADSVEPILIPLAADAAHPFPFISNLGLNLAVLVTEPGHRNRRFVRIKVSASRPRWVPLPDHAGWVPLEQVIAGNLSVLFPRAVESACSFFRVTRGAKDDPWADQVGDEDVDLSPGAIIGMVTAKLTARKCAGVVRVEVSAGMPAGPRGWLAARRRPCRRHRDCRAAEPRGPQRPARDWPCRAA